jgi:peroxiredoxin Q/BCP
MKNGIRANMENPARDGHVRDQMPVTRRVFHVCVWYISFMPSLNSAAPDFKLPDQDGKEHSLSYHRGSWVLLYFYPKDDTPGCTKEACSIRDSFPALGELSAKVFGVSTDSVASHKKFAEKYGLPFTLLADEDKTVVKAYGVWGKKNFMGKEYEGTLRTSFLIDPKGNIAKIYENVKPEKHAEEVIFDLKKLRTEAL